MGKVSNKVLIPKVMHGIIQNENQIETLKKIHLFFNTHPTFVLTSCQSHELSYTKNNVTLLYGKMFKKRENMSSNNVVILLLKKFPILFVNDCH